MIHTVFVRMTWRERVLEWLIPRRRRAREAQMRRDMREIADNPRLKVYFRD